jgi:hypothetical protein
LASISTTPISTPQSGTGGGGTGTGGGGTGGGGTGGGGTGGGGTGTGAALVTVESVEVVKKKHKVTEVLVVFSGALNATEAESIAEYDLITVGKKGSFTAKSAKAIKLRAAAYNSSTNTVTLTPRKAFALSKKVELVVNGTAPSGLEDSYGRLIDGNNDGQAGGNATAILTARGATLSALSGGAAAFDQLVDRGDLPALAKVRKS